MQTHVAYTRADDVAYLTLACDEAGKPATLDMTVLDELADELRTIERSGDIRAVVVRSAAQKYFVVGANVNALETLDQETIVPWIEKGHAVFNQIESLPVPVLARIAGYTLGGGLELAMACDLIIASREAKLGQPEANLGFVPGWGGSYRLPRRIGLSRAKELCFTGKIIAAQEAYAIGLVDFVGSKEETDDYLASFLERLRQCSPVAIAETKRLLNQAFAGTAPECCGREADASHICVSTGDTQARVVAFLERRKKT